MAVAITVLILLFYQDPVIKVQFVPTLCHQHSSADNGSHRQQHVSCCLTQCAALTATCQSLPYTISMWLCCAHISCKALRQQQQGIQHVQACLASCCANAVADTAHGPRANTITDIGEGQEGRLRRRCAAASSQSMRIHVQ